MKYRSGLWRSRRERNIIAVILTLWRIGIVHDLATGQTDVDPYNWPSW